MLHKFALQLPQQGHLFGISHFLVDVRSHHCYLRERLGEEATGEMGAEPRKRAKMPERLQRYLGGLQGLIFAAPSAEGDTYFFVRKGLGPCKQPENATGRLRYLGTRWIGFIRNEGRDCPLHSGLEDA